MIHFGPVPTETIFDVWPRLHAYAQKLQERSGGEVTPELILRKCASQEWMLWVALERDMQGSEVLGFLTTAIRDDHRRTVIMLNLSGRNFEKWQDLGIAQVESWAREIGATHISGVCRDGLVRRMSKHGFRKTTNVIEKAL